VYDKLREYMLRQLSVEYCPPEFTVRASWAGDSQARQKAILDLPWNFALKIEKAIEQGVAPPVLPADMFAAASGTHLQHLLGWNMDRAKDFKRPSSYQPTGSTPLPVVGRDSVSDYGPPALVTGRESSTMAHSLDDRPDPLASPPESTPRTGRVWADRFV